MVRLDYCNALLCGAREDVIRQLERLQSQAARGVCKKYKHDHTSVTALMWGLHWLPIPTRTYSVQNTAPCLQGVY